MSKGFTFVEIVVALAILLGLVGVGTASYVNFNERTILEDAAQDLKSTLRVAQENAIAGVKDNVLCDPDGPSPAPAETFRGWCISPVNSDPVPTPGDPYDSYQIYGVCDTNEDGIGVRVFPAVGQIERLSLPQGVSLITRAFKNNGTPYEENTVSSRARFNVFGNDVRLADDALYTKVVYCLQGSFPSLGDADVYQITIQQSGEINDDGFVNDCATS
jgi:prepilin-type N-terminal cleavage/methylation domain-containing protein